MRKLLLATAAFAFVGAGSALASDAEVTITSELAAECNVSDATTDIELVGTGSEDGDFTTTCNFSAASLTVNFVSTYGGVYNTVEDVTAPYTLTYNTHTHDSSTLTGAGQDETHPSGSLGPVVRTYSVALNDPLEVAGEYTDTLAITVTP